MNYYNKNNHLQRIPVAAKNVDHTSGMAGEKLKSDKVHLFSLWDGTRISDNEYLESLETATVLTVCTRQRMHELSIYFDIKR